MFFAFAILTLPVEAKNDKAKGKPPKQENKKDNGNRGNNNGNRGNNSDRARNRGNIVVNVMKSSWGNFDRARSNGLTLRDFITASYIASQVSDHDFMSIFALKKNGKPYKEICKALGINWGSVRRHVKGQYNVMNEDAVKAGLVIWALDEILS